ncbi:hypothetical protein [Variovorax sp. OV329]|uniref:hypothetical protein n=1 Tax=Variovorax sp. OV329 TaxID=1882825 RepID=UPI0008E78BAC|nr:hypothetical protein [Variovorax sp. OV329]SFM20501.1 hypothetical protein SAMN05444747_103315 [Variovorax sp. OV329]
MNTDPIQEAGRRAPVGSAFHLLPTADALDALYGIFFSLGWWCTKTIIASQPSLLGSLLIGMLPLARSAAQTAARRVDWRARATGSRKAPSGRAAGHAELVPGLLALRYLAFSLPAFAACLLGGYFGLQAISIGYGLATASLALTTACPKGQGAPAGAGTRSPARIPCACARLHA